MYPERPSSHDYAPNAYPQANPERATNFPSDEELLRGFLLDLRASGRKPKTEFIYGDSVERLSRFRRDMGMPALAVMTAEHVREYLAHLGEKGNKLVRYVLHSALPTTSFRIRSIRPDPANNSHILHFSGWLAGKWASGPLPRPSLLSLVPSPPPFSAYSVCRTRLLDTSTSRGRRTSGY